jgi:hypothetical protein
VIHIPGRNARLQNFVSAQLDAIARRVFAADDNLALHLADLLTLPKSLPRDQTFAKMRRFDP